MRGDVMGLTTSDLLIGVAFVAVFSCGYGLAVMFRRAEARPFQDEVKFLRGRLVQQVEVTHLLSKALIERNGGRSL